jgi:biopolymer transport protein ExbD
MQFDGRARVSTRIDMAPLVDVVFLLLIFFLLTSSFVSNRAIELDLPTSTTAAAVPEPPLVVSILADGTVRLGDQPVATAHLASALAVQMSRDSSGEIAIRADESVDVARLLVVLDAVREGGGRELSLMAEPGATE